MLKVYNDLDKIIINSCNKSQSFFKITNLCQYFLKIYRNTAYSGLYFVVMLRRYCLENQKVLIHPHFVCGLFMVLIGPFDQDHCLMALLAIKIKSLVSCDHLKDIEVIAIDNVKAPVIFMNDVVGCPINPEKLC